MLQKILRIFADPPQPADAGPAPGIPFEPVISRLEREAGEGNVDAIYLLGVAKDPAVANQRFAPLRPPLQVGPPKKKSG
ncbi:hypothetical protein [Methanocorpusculum labreanum]|uniref:hypothetical protein n=1 Tax=Methanocorpusculum labreanum TaxID=83984 RepID=UPI00064E3ED5|nr:hypothetical protein [Methanocorpusculum labreanum]